MFVTHYHICICMCVCKTMRVRGSVLAGGQIPPRSRVISLEPNWLSEKDGKIETYFKPPSAGLRCPDGGRGKIRLKNTCDYRKSVELVHFWGLICEDSVVRFGEIWARMRVEEVQAACRALKVDLSGSGAQNSSQGYEAGSGQHQAA